MSQTAAQVVRLTQSGAGTVTWTATSNQPWLQVSPASGSGSANLSVSVVSVGGLPVGSTVTGAITLALTGASNTPGPITVSLNLVPNGTSASPFGIRRHAAEQHHGRDGGGPFTGWALDDIEVTRVMVCRAAFGAKWRRWIRTAAGRRRSSWGLRCSSMGRGRTWRRSYPDVPDEHAGAAGASWC